MVGRVAILVSAVVMAVAAFAGAATARNIDGTAGDDVLTGTSERDVIQGFGGDDRIVGRASGDVLVGGSGVDTLVGNGGNDRIDSVDGERDFVVCNGGDDDVRADVRDSVAADCEDVQRVEGDPAPPTGGGDTDCSDDIDNDGDGQTDFPGDPGCSGPDDTNESGDGGRVTICHKPGAPAEKTMSVPQAALKGHLGHGDYLGPCDG